MPIKTDPIPIFDTQEAFLAHGSQPPKQIVDPERIADYQLSYLFLQSYRGSEATFRAYRRDLERLLQWCWYVQALSLSKLTRQQFETFIEFCQTPPSNWIGEKQVSRFIISGGVRVVNQAWRPFVKSPKDKSYYLSATALQSLFSVCSSFFNFLIQENYLSHNPVMQIRQKSKYFRKQQSGKQIRRLSALQWHYVIETTEMLADQDPEKHERTLFILNALYAMYLRISELAASKRWQPTMGDFHLDHDGNWWFTTVGKGNKERKISVSNDMLAALKRYRRSLNLSDLPHPGETVPLITKARGTGPITSTRMIRRIVSTCFNKAIARLRSDGLEYDADTLATATVHWLRHTSISEDVKLRPREHVRDDAGHSSSAITDKYIDIELRARAHSAKKKKIKPLTD